MLLSYNTGEVNLKYVGRSDVGSILRPVTRKDKFLMHSDPTPNLPCVKTCTKCGIAKPATSENFVRDKTRDDGLFPWCKACKNKYSDKDRKRWRAYRVANRENIAAYNQSYKAKNRESLLAYKRAYREANKEQIASYQRSYNPEYRVRNAERLADYGYKWRARNSERRSLVRRAYREANPDKIRANEQRRRARLLNADGHYTGEDVRTQFERQKGHCYYCHEKLGDKYHVDHIVPLARGGSNWPENIVIACRHCNESKGAKLPHEWPQGGRLL